MHAEASTFLQSLAVILCVCVFVKDDRTTADMWQNDRSTVTHLYRHAYTKTHNQSHSLTGWAGKLEIGGSEDHAELVGFLYAFVLVCMSEFIPL